MKRRWAFSLKACVAKITKPICGNTAGRVELVVFDFRMGREREGPRRFLGNFEGVLQSDGYAASVICS